jgi:hypothetical protein
MRRVLSRRQVKRLDACQTTCSLFRPVVPTCSVEELLWRWRACSWSRFREQVRWPDQVDTLGDAWLDGIAPSKIAGFAGEAGAQDAGTLSHDEAVRSRRNRSDLMAVTPTSDTTI